MSTKKITGRGGPGRGQGRKATSPSGQTRIRFEMKIDPVILAKLRERQEPVSRLIEQALIEHYGIDFNLETSV